MKTIKVTNCHDCLFVDFQGAFGYSGCNLGMFMDKMPEYTTHKDCPLIENPLTITL